MSEGIFIDDIAAIAHIGFQVEFLSLDHVAGLVHHVAFEVHAVHLEAHVFQGLFRGLLF